VELFKRKDVVMSPEDEVRAVSAAWDEALVANDADAIARFMAEDWTFVSADGVTSKADIVGWIKSGRLRHDTMTSRSPDHAVRAGDAVVLTARKASTGVWDATPYTADEWISEIYVRTSGGWRCVLSHKSAATP
jgi:ketosteroid isomerase-like protein